MNNQVVLHVVIEALPGHEDELGAQLAALVAPTRGEPGCLEYRLHNDPGRPGTFMFYERFASQIDLEAHQKTAHFQRFVQYRATASPDPVRDSVVARWHVFV